MAVQITIIGTGQIGSSMGLALGQHKDMFFRIGHDKDFRLANRAKDMGAFDKVDVNLPNSVVDSGIIVLALPLDQILETLTFIAPDIREEAVIMDTAPVKSEVMQWMKEMLPPNRHYVGLAPVIKTWPCWNSLRMPSRWKDWCPESRAFPTLCRFRRRSADTVP